MGLILCASAALLVWHSLRYDFVTDDAYISFVYARNLAEHGELTFNLGDYVEGYSNFSWTVLLAGLMALGIPPELASRVLGTACGVLVLGVVMKLARRVSGRPGSLWPVLPAVLLAGSSGFACWSSGGLETQLFTLLCMAAIERFAAALERTGGEAMIEDRLIPSPGRRRWIHVGALLALAALTRPEGLLLAAVLGACAGGTNLLQLLHERAGQSSTAEAGSGGTARTRDLRQGIRHVLSGLIPAPQRAAIIAFLALWIPWFAWRYWYYGWPFPNTYYVKAHGPWRPPELAGQMWSNGGYYLLTWLRQTGLLWAWPLVVLGFLSTRTSRERLVRAVPLMMFAISYLLYTASVGGDFMGLHRFIMPVFAIAAIGVMLGLEWLCRLPALSERFRCGASLVAVFGVLVAFAVKQSELTARSVRWGHFEADRGIDPPAFLMVYTRDRAEIGKALKSCLRSEDFSIVGGAGAQPYFGRMRAIDVFGLVSEEVAHQEPRTRARAGHTKFASDALLLKSDPTFIFSCYVIHSEAAPPGLPCAAPWLKRGFEIATMHIPGLRQGGTYYSFLVKKSRAFQCRGRAVEEPSRR